MESISEEEFDLLVHHTLRIELTDGSVLIYSVLPSVKGELISTMRRLSLNSREVKSGTISFVTLAKRMVFINTKYLLNLIFCFDFLVNSDPRTYYDNFEVLPEDSKSQARVQIADVIPDVILKLAHPTSLTQSQTLLFDDVLSGTLANLNEPWGSHEGGSRRFIELEDEDGEPNFINLEYVMCIEAAWGAIDEDERDQKILSLALGEEGCMTMLIQRG
jgi:hypothetical protein